MWEQKVGSGLPGSCLDDKDLHGVDRKCWWDDANVAWIDLLNNRCDGEQHQEGDAKQRRV